MEGEPDKAVLARFENGEDPVRGLGFESSSFRQFLRERDMIELEVDRPVVVEVPAEGVVQARVPPLVPRDGKAGTARRTIRVMGHGVYHAFTESGVCEEPHVVSLPLEGFIGESVRIALWSTEKN